MSEIKPLENTYLAFINLKLQDKQGTPGPVKAKISEIASNVNAIKDEFTHHATLKELLSKIHTDLDELKKLPDQYEKVKTTQPVQAQKISKVFGEKKTEIKGTLTSAYHILRGVIADLYIKVEAVPGIERKEGEASDQITTIIQLTTTYKQQTKPDKPLGQTMRNILDHANQLKKQFQGGTVRHMKELLPIFKNYIDEISKGDSGEVPGTTDFEIKHL